MAVTSVAGSFRDPAGHLFERDGVLYRTVSAGFADDYTAFVDSGLYAALVDEGLLIPHDEADPGLAPDGAWKVLRPERLPVISYPYEWAPGQLRDAALATLRIQELALAHGMTLRDASAYNIQLRAGRALCIDTLSFARREADRPWVAYGQFCRHFLAPLALACHVDVRLTDLLTTHIDGIPLDLAASLLPGRTRLSPGLLQHLHLHARAQRTREAVVDEPSRQPRFSERAMIGLVESLRGAVRRLTWEPGRTTWSDYYAEAGHYSDRAMAHKQELVARHVRAADPATVCDLGANTGRFSRLAAEHGATVVALDVDHGAVEVGWRALHDDPPARGDVLPLRIDLSAPSPAIGWANRERMTLSERGPFDLVLALALVHHLAIGNNVPLPRVGAHLAELGRHVLVEFVPKSDPKVQVLLATREDVFDDYTREAFEQAVAAHADILAADEIDDSDRVLYLLRSRRPDGGDAHGAAGEAG